MTVALQGVAHVFPNGHRPLDGVDLVVRAGERVALVGASGAGKTTLLRVIGAALRPAAGEVALFGANPWRLSAGGLRRTRARIGRVHQSPPLPPRQRVVTAVLAGRLGQWSAGRALRSLLVPVDVDGAREALAPLGLADRVFDRCDRLSGGQLQRVAVARVLYQRADLLLADEPVSALDPATADQCLEALVRQSDATGAALVASLHAVDLALKWFPRVVGVRAGRIAFDLPASAVTPALLQALYAGEGAAMGAVDGAAAVPGPGAGTGSAGLPATMCR